MRVEADEHEDLRSERQAEASLRASRCRGRHADSGRQAVAARGQEGACGDRSLGQGSSPSTELRKWFGHDPVRWQDFRRRYAAELRQRSDQLDQLRDLARQGPITLVYAAHDELHNDAVVLRDVLLGR